jgi:hypothetical protein
MISKFEPTVQGMSLLVSNCLTSVASEAVEQYRTTTVCGCARTNPSIAIAITATNTEEINIVFCFLLYLFQNSFILSRYFFYYI